MNGDRETKCNQCIITLLGYITSLIAHMHLPTTCQANSIQFKWDGKFDEKKSWVTYTGYGYGYRVPL